MNATPSVPRPEYPRPQFARAEWLNLNGEWDFEIDYGVSGEARGLTTGRPLGGKIVVPFCPESELSGIGNKDFMASVWYRREVEVPADWTAQGKRVVLHFGACDYDTTVWVNGIEAGTHRGGYVSFSFDITDHLNASNRVSADGSPVSDESQKHPISRPDTIVIRAVDDTRDKLQATGKQSDKYNSYGCLYTRTTGIWQTVWLEAVEPTHLRSVRYYPDVDQGRITIHAAIDGVTDGYTLQATVCAGEKEVGKAELAATRLAVFTISLAERRLWEPGDGFLYDVEFKLVKNGATGDTVKSYFGLRNVAIDGKRVLINNKPVFQRLILDQGFYPDGIYTASTDEALRHDIEMSLAMGFNGARLHQKVFEPRFLYWADRMGYLTWGEYPNWGMDHANPYALERMTREWVDEVERDFNHPSIVGWCPFNETATTQNPELLRMTYRITKAIDPTRPVIDTSGYVHVETDIYDCHNYEQDPRKFAAAFEAFKTGETVYRNFTKDDAEYQGQPYFCSEYGGIWWNPGQVDSKSWGYGDRPRTEAQFIERYKALTEALLLHPKMFAFCYTQLTDVEQEVNGLYTYDRKPKFDPAIICAINTQRAAIETTSLVQHYPHTQPVGAPEPAPLTYEASAESARVVVPDPSGNSEGTLPLMNAPAE
jgi:beta-galactosidase/beta-glucuronidase